MAYNSVPSLVNGVTDTKKITLGVGDRYGFLEYEGYIGDHRSLREITFVLTDWTAINSPTPLYIHYTETFNWHGSKYVISGVVFEMENPSITTNYSYKIVLEKLS